MAWSENLDLNKCKELDVLPSSKEDLIKTSDFISITCSRRRKIQGLH